MPPKPRKSVNATADRLSSNFVLVKVYTAFRITQGADERGYGRENNGRRVPLDALSKTSVSV